MEVEDPSVRQQAEDLKNVGNEHYKNGNLIEAIKFYESAIQIGAEADVPTYLSNLSAAYYESGYYEKSLDSIDRAFELLQTDATPESSIPLDIKLRVRECRCLLQIQEFDQLLDAVQEVDQAVYDSHVEFGVIEDAALHSLDQLGAWDAERARKFVPTLPRYRPRVKRRRPRYGFGISHDTATSALIVATDTKEQKAALKRNSRIIITNLLPHQCNLSFFYGGVSDSRHVLATMIDVLQQDPGTFEFTLKMALVDQSPAVVARNVLIFFILDDLSKRELEKRSIETTELLALLHYTYIGAIMPAWLHEKLLGFVRIVSNKLCSGLGVPSWLSISLDSIHKIMPIFKFWIRGATDSACMKDVMAMQKPLDGPADIFTYPNIPPELKQRLKDSRDQARIDIKDAIFNFTDSQLNHILANKIPEAKKMTLEKKKKLAYRMFATDEALDQLNRKRYVPDGLLMEYSTFYQGNLKMLYVPDELTHREPKLTALLKEIFTSYSAGAKKVQEPETASKGALLQSIRHYLERHWVVNVTLIDESWSTSDDRSSQSRVSFDPFAASQQLVAQTNVRPLMKPCRTYDYTAAFFLNAARSIKKYGHRFLFEWMVDESHDVLERMSRSPEDSHFDLFDRVYFSTPPDITGGLLTQVVDVMPLLKPSQHVFMASKIIHNGIHFHTLEELLSEYTLLSSAAEAQRQLGIGLHGSATQDFYLTDQIRLRPAEPANAASLALAPSKTRYTPLHRHEVTEWLYQVFLKTALPYKQQADSTIQQPLNLHSFFRLLLYLQSVDFPGHWLSSVLDDIIQNRVITRARASPTKDTTPKQISMTPFSMEMEVALTMWFPLLTFGITAVEFSDAAHVKQYSITFPVLPHPRSTTHHDNTNHNSSSSSSNNDNKYDDSQNGNDNISDEDEDAAGGVLALWFSTNTAKKISTELGRDIVGSHNGCKSIRLLSTFTFTPITSSVVPSSGHPPPPTPISPHPHPPRAPHTSNTTRLTGSHVTNADTSHETHHADSTPTSSSSPTTTTTTTTSVTTGYTATWWANASSMDLLQIQNFSVRVVRVDTWDTVSAIVPVSKASWTGAVLSEWQEPV